jgi:hypothetical protein
MSNVFFRDFDNGYLEKNQVFELLFLNLVRQKRFQLEEKILFHHNRSEEIIIETQLVFFLSLSKIAQSISLKYHVSMCG